jgi:histidinol phosphatase-like enzyme
MKYIVFDRDGTFVKHLPYLSDPRLIELLPGVKESLTYLKARAFIFFYTRINRELQEGILKLKMWNLVTEE